MARSELAEECDKTVAVVTFYFSQSMTTTCV